MIKFVYAVFLTIALFSAKCAVASPVLGEVTEMSIDGGLFVILLAAATYAAHIIRKEKNVDNKQKL